MALEAIAGKNPVSHVGKIYNVLAREIANELRATIPEITTAQCIIASQIGSPITELTLAHVRLATQERFPVARLKLKVAEVVANGLARAPKLVGNFIARSIAVF